MAIKYNNEYETERRGSTQKTVDKLYNTMYNKGDNVTRYDVGDYVNKQKTEPDTTKRFGFAPEINGWAKKNSDAIKYAGDGVINSIKRATKDYINKYLKDAPEETDKDELFDSIAKWQLARDANDEKRGNVAMNNIIGHMSTENKDYYLKEQIPFADYVRAKDDFDYKTGKYTTTEYASKAADKAVKKIQQKLNAKGYTDQYGDLLITNNGTKFASAGGPMSPRDMDMDTVVKAIQSESSATGRLVYTNDMPNADMTKYTQNLERTSSSNEDETFLDNLKKYAKMYYNYITDYGYVRSEMKKVSQEFLTKEKGYLTSAWLFEHSLQNNPENVYRGDNSRIAQLIKDDSSFKNVLWQIVKKNSDKDEFVVTQSVYFNSGDLLYSIHASNITFTGKKTKNGWMVTCSLKDTYDFSKFFSYKDSPVASFANNIAVICEDMGAIKPYDVHVDFTVDVEGE